MSREGHISSISGLEQSVSRENDEVLATGEALFGSGRNIEQDESATDRVTFWGLGDLTIDQVELVYDLTWQDLSPLP